MGSQSCLTAYVGYHALSLLTGAVELNDEAGFEREAMQAIWEHYKKDRLRLVTSGEAMELDMVIAFNVEGCCITDTYMITENIGAFEAWQRADRSLTEKWRQAVDLFDQLEVLGREHEGLQSEEDTLFAYIRGSLLCGENGNAAPFHGNESDAQTLRSCAQHFQDWYGEDRWRDLRRIEYDLHWKILESELRRRSTNPVFEGKDGKRNRYLLGLLNRVVGFSKKSCPRLPMSPGHIDFVIQAVMKKYGGHRRENEIRHIIHCIENDIDFLITIDGDLVTRFNNRREELLKHPECCSMKLLLVKPSELASRLTAIHL